MVQGRSAEVRKPFGFVGTVAVPGRSTRLSPRGRATFITDADAGALKGIAVTAVTGTGTWQYFNGAIWVAIAPVSTSSALLLDSSTLVRFVPNAGFVGTANLTYRANGLVDDGNRSLT